MSSTLNIHAINNLLSGKSHDPFAVLGAHPFRDDQNDSGLVVRAFLPGAQSVFVLDLDPDKNHEATLINDQGLFEVILHGIETIKPYRFRVDFGVGTVSTFYDCYSFSPVISDYDLYLYNQGNHYEIYNRLGAHPWLHQGISGVLFAVWAPSATRVSVIGDFNQWDGRRHQMRVRGSSGVWELFIPHLQKGMLYKFEVRTKKGTLLTKADPFAFCFEQRPKTAAIIYDVEQFRWTDEIWMRSRTKKNHLTQPLSIYEVHLGSWRRRAEEDNRWLTYRESVEELIPYVKDLGFNAIEFLPLAEHPFDGSWGYQVTGYYAATSRFGSPDDLMYLVNECHKEGLAVILDWVPAHFPKDSYALEYFDGTHLYEHADPRKGIQRDWDTLIFNYGRNEVRNFLVANALFWLEKYHIDGLRIDAVAAMLYLDYSRKDGEWIPNQYGGNENLEAIEFIKILNTKIYERFPGVMTIAEESTAWPGVSRPVHLGGLGFLFKWNMGWMHDMLTFMSKDPIHRRFHMEMLTFALLYAFHENFILPLSHDEVVHGKASLLSKMPGDDWQKFANLRLLLGYMYGEPGKKMLFMGGEFGQWWEWDHQQSLQWHLLEFEPHQGLQRYVKDLNRTYLSQPAMYENDFDPSGFEWIDFRDADSTVVSFIRKGKSPDDMLVFVFNFTPVPRIGYRIGVFKKGHYDTLINSDADDYGGSGFGLSSGIIADAIPWHGKPYSLDLDLPPLGMLLLKPSEIENH
ncbi:MAG: 1,4-alpha-glucan branching protein GlgB [Deltaproteobacteria bacterium]|nr:1,4-alpha-glucan branching protein GlgB [Deltaproteobacteria bacterium]